MPLALVLLEDLLLPHINGIRESECTLRMLAALFIYSGEMAPLRSAPRPSIDLT